MNKWDALLLTSRRSKIDVVHVDVVKIAALESVVYQVLAASCKHQVN